ncbi:sensor histidine kinase [Paenibacillus sp. OAS669]|uniref:ATP-binding protein n=1 Tax=Paenibacillus sp. OAS669 TaxID=2663821 RepID=UPI00178BE681|nr:sensor histidine kinase [Paenibacillus sp. OAS669]MBE1443394.1 two-component system sporulation sensor kinase B [Paenibacillus sp. OAS669]
MLIYFKDYLLNLFFIFSPFVLYPYIYKTKKRPLLYRFLIYTLFACALIVTMSFPTHLDGLLFDFRSIPLTLGSFYGGNAVSAFLYITLMGYRLIMGYPNNFIYAISLAPSFLILLYYIKKYPTYKLHQKVWSAVWLCSFIKLTTFTLYLALTDHLELLWIEPITKLETYLLQGLIAGLCVYLIEFLNNYFYMQEEVVNSEKVKIVSDMAASVAHEIRNPLTTVRGFIQLLGSASLDQEKKQYYQKLCLEELDRAQVIITDYLSLAKPDPEVIEKINVNEEVRYLSNVLLTYANYYNIQIDGNVGQDEALYILGDKYKFRQAFINIGKNAIEAMVNGGLLAFTVKSQENHVSIIVSDSGVGMTEEQVRRLGTPYFSTKEKGTGLGTMVSFGIIRKMNGKIELRSELGKGTVYTVVFPRV